MFDVKRKPEVGSQDKEAKQMVQPAPCPPGVVNCPKAGAITPAQRAGGKGGDLTPAASERGIMDRYDASAKGIIQSIGR
jgi:hypothetical protein